MREHAGCCCQGQRLRPVILQRSGGLGPALVHPQRDQQSPAGVGGGRGSSSSEREGNDRPSKRGAGIIAVTMVMAVY